MDEHTRAHLHETSVVVWGPLVVLAIPSIIVGAIAIEPMLFGDYFGGSIFVDSENDVLVRVSEGYHGVVGFVGHGMLQAPFWLAMAGVLVAWYCYLKRPDIPHRIAERTSIVHRILINKYGFDAFNERFFAGGARSAGRMLWRVGDVELIDGIMVNGSAKFVGWWSSVMRHIQSGYLYHYAFAMILGLLVLLAVFIHGVVG